jgi:hypothetical protein
MFCLGINEGARQRLLALGEVAAEAEKPAPARPGPSLCRDEAVTPGAKRPCAAFYDRLAALPAGRIGPTGSLAALDEPFPLAATTVKPIIAPTSSSTRI